ncbi:TPA: hypothetical protein DEF17_08120, partial [bacterium]|nr:hypothetical protein [bacterium]
RRGLLLFAALFFTAVPSRAQETSAEPTLSDLVRTLDENKLDETVRRIVERAMAAVELAEAKATRKNAEIQLTVNELSDQLARKDSEILELNNLLKAERANVSSLSNKLTEYDSKIEILRDSTSRLNAILLRSQNENEELKQRVESLHTSMSLSEKAYYDALGRAEAAESKIAETSMNVNSDSIIELTNKLEALEKSNQDLKSKLDGYRYRSSLLEQNLIKDSEIISELVNENGKLTQQTIELTNKFNELETASIRLKEEKDKLRQKFETALADRDSIAAALKVNQMEIIETMRVVKESANAIRMARAERDAALAKLTSISSVEQANVEELQEKLRRYQDEISALRIALVSSIPVSIPLNPQDSSVIVEKPVDTSNVVSIPPERKKLDLNSASFEELAGVPEIGETRARAIVWYRENVKNLMQIEELKNVPGFNDDRIKALQIRFDL